MNQQSEQSKQQQQVTFYLHRVRINSGGYDSEGSYFGVGMPVYHYQAEFPDTLEHTFSLIRECDTDLQADGAVVQTASGTKCAMCGHSVKRVNNCVSDYLRAYDRESAKAKVKAKYPQARFAR